MELRAPENMDRDVMVLLAKLKRRLKKELPVECRDKAIKIVNEYQSELEELLASSPWP